MQKYISEKICLKVKPCPNFFIGPQGWEVLWRVVAREWLTIPWERDCRDTMQVCAAEVGGVLAGSFFGVKILVLSSTRDKNCCPASMKGHNHSGIGCTSSLIWGMPFGTVKVACNQWNAASSQIPSACIYARTSCLTVTQPDSCLRLHWRTGYHVGNWRTWFLYIWRLFQPGVRTILKLLRGNQTSQEMGNTRVSDSKITFDCQKLPSNSSLFNFLVY